MAAGWEGFAWRTQPPTAPSNVHACCLKQQCCLHGVNAVPILAGRGRSWSLLLCVFSPWACNTAHCVCLCRPSSSSFGPLATHGGASLRQRFWRLRLLLTCTRTLPSAGRDGFCGMDVYSCLSGFVLVVVSVQTKALCARLCNWHCLSWC